MDIEIGLIKCKTDLSKGPDILKRQRERIQAPPRHQPKAVRKLSQKPKAKYENSKVGQKTSSHVKFDHAHETKGEHRPMSSDVIIDINPPSIYMVRTTTDTAYAGLRTVLSDNEIIFDPVSTINLFKNGDLLDGDLNDANITGISTYGGCSSAKQKYKDMLTYVNPNGLASLLSQRCLRTAGTTVEYLSPSPPVNTADSERVTTTLI